MKPTVQVQLSFVSAVYCASTSPLEAGLAGLGASSKTGSGYTLSTCGAPGGFLVTICDF